MSFTSLIFLLLFLPAVYGLYASCASAVGQNIVLLVAGLIFYGFFDFKYVLVLLACIALTYGGAMIGAKLRSKSREKSGRAVIITAVTLNLLILGVCKYADFTVENLNNLLHLDIQLPEILLPIGLSFYIFQSSSYLFDVLRGKGKPETNLLHYALFVSFFPTIVSGPIQRADKLLPQIRAKRDATWEKFIEAAILFLWGMFQKIVVADHLAAFTDNVFTYYSSYGFLVISLGVFAYAVQIYADFAGYSSMAIGLATLFGFQLEDNFRQPYAARTIGDFWRRWHISLSTWFRDYIYIPMGGSRKGTFRKYLNIAVVFLVSGLWHGASWTFVIWGGIHALYQIIGGITRPLRQKIVEMSHIRTDCFSYRLLQRACVFVLVSFAWIFFRMDTLEGAMDLIEAMFGTWDYYAPFIGTFSELGLNTITVFGVLALLTVSILKEKGFSARVMAQQNGYIHFIYCFVMILVIILFGAYGPAFSSSAFIYAGF